MKFEREEITVARVVKFEEQIGARRMGGGGDFNSVKNREEMMGIGSRNILV